MGLGQRGVNMFHHIPVILKVHLGPATWEDAPAQTRSNAKVKMFHSFLSIIQFWQICWSSWQDNLVMELDIIQNFAVLAVSRW